MSATSERGIARTEALLSTEQFVMGADDKEADHPFSFMIKDRTIITCYVYASTARVGIVKWMVVKDGIKRVCKEQVSASFKLLL